MTAHHQTRSRNLNTRAARQPVIAKLHVAKRELGLDDETFRDVMGRVTGKRSMRDMSVDELTACVAEFRAHGFTPKRKAGRGRKPSYGESRYLPKIRALWLSAYELGIVRDKADEAMQAFIKRQTGLDSTRWLNHAEDADKVIEALKAWMAREANVDFKRRKSVGPGQSVTVDPREAIVTAQFTELVNLGFYEPFAGKWHENDICHWAYKHIGKTSFSGYAGEDWTRLIQLLGWALRKARAPEGEAG